MMFGWDGEGFMMIYSTLYMIGNSVRLGEYNLLG